MDIYSFTGELPGVLDDHQCFPLSEDGIMPAFRAVYLPTFNHKVIVTLRCPPDQPVTLTITSTEEFERPFFNPLTPMRPSRYSSKRELRRLRRRRRRGIPDPEPEPPLPPPPPPPPLFPWPLAWWVLPGVRRPSALFQRVFPVPDAALARWRASLEGLDLLMADHKPEFEWRDGIVTIGEVLLPHGSAVFSAWNSRVGTPWQQYFTAMLDLCLIGHSDPLIMERLSEIRQYSL